MTEKLTAANAARQLAVVPDSVCACSTCQNMCERRPCWTTPKEAQAIIDAGLGDRLMRDYWVGNPLRDGYSKGDTSLLVPAIAGYESRDCPEGNFFVGPEGRCTFLTRAGRCELHDKGLKPSEGRKAIHDGGFETGKNVHRLCAATWATAKARKLVTDWQATRTAEVQR
jgi:hypothetical protein